MVTAIMKPVGKNYLNHLKLVKKIGLLRDELIPEYEKLGVMGYADGDSDYETSWEELSKPLKTS